MKVFSIIESPSHPQLGQLLNDHGYEEIIFTTMRKAIQALKQTRPQLVIADFLYGYGNNYAGVNISNLDVFLYSLDKYAPEARVLALYEKSEKKYIEEFSRIFPDVICVELPVNPEQIEQILQQ